MARERDDRAAPIQWRWYHFYFLLALFDLVIIIGSLFLHHHTLHSYALALEKLGKLHTRQRWVAGLRLAVVGLNAPGNDLFATHEFDVERERFESAKTKIQRMLRQSHGYGIDVAEFRVNLDKMIQHEAHVFTILAGADQDAVARESDRNQLVQATVTMAAMDRDQAAALTNLTELDQHLLMRVDTLLTDYALYLVFGANLEKYILALVVLILLGVFWYGRKLQQMHEQMVADQHTAIIARHDRLAAVGKLCTAVAHGIRNPLASILTSAQLSLGENNGEPLQRRLGDIVDECRRLEHRLTRLLNYAAGSPAQFEDYDVRATIEQATDEISDVLRDAGITLDLELGKQPMLVHGDRERMVQAFIEILSNAAEHARPTHVTITITGRESDPDTGNEVAIEVRDTGPGIQEENRERVFDLFFTTSARGTGIGLSAVRDTVESHGGTISIEAAHPSGMVLQVCLPRR